MLSIEGQVLMGPRANFVNGVWVMSSQVTTMCICSMLKSNHTPKSLFKDNLKYKTTLSGFFVAGFDWTYFVRTTIHTYSHIIHLRTNDAR